MRSTAAFCIVATSSAFRVGIPARVTAPQPVIVRADVRAQSIMDLLMGSMSDPTMVEPKDALPGREQKMMIPDRHYVLGNKMDVVPEGHKVAVFANGCFWGSEKVSAAAAPPTAIYAPHRTSSGPIRLQGIWRLPGDGIYSTAVGYCAGFTPNPTYEEACSGRTGHTEGVRVVYDPAKISFVDILRWFWEAHDPASVSACAVRTDTLSTHPKRSSHACASRARRAWARATTAAR
eukprot:7389272-Prymnesium_polylepis.1